ncbi:MAG TPA: hypothetical protein VFS32_01310, partial [Candidatus Limnocylindrales bacterium]|nr:hypothetical protein [Candidatus Limnocylindrales bacterium]
AQAFEVVAKRVDVVGAELGGDVSLAGAQPLVMRALAGARTVDATRGAPGGAVGTDAAADPRTAGTTTTESSNAAEPAAALPGGSTR